MSSTVHGRSVRPEAIDGVVLAFRSLVRVEWTPDIPTNTYLFFDVRRIERPEFAALLGGTLVMLGAWLTWLTMFAGLQQYGGLIGVHGHILFAGGALAIIGSIGTLRTRRRQIRSGTALLGVTLLGFNWWLLVGLVGMLHHGLSAMFCPS
jgi:hypothetical protein